jgi:hypothetical protein
MSKTPVILAAVAIGYDWIYHHLTKGERKAIETALLELGLKTTLVRDNNRN